MIRYSSIQIINLLVSQIFKTFPLCLFSTLCETELQSCTDICNFTTASMISSPTRWTVKANAMKSILDNYAAVIQTFENDVKDSKSMPIGKSNYQFNISPLDGACSHLADFVYFPTPVVPSSRANSRARNVNKTQIGHSAPPIG